MDINKLTDKDVGRWVIYTAGDGHTERGKIKRFSVEYNLIYVVYGVAYGANDSWDLDHWKDYTAAATEPTDLEFA